MRMRKKKHGAERIAACAELLIPTPSANIADPKSLFPDPDKPLHLEIGCGKGDFAVGMAKRYPGINFIAMEKFADAACLALEKAKATAEERTADNLRFLIGDAKNLSEWFPARSFDCIYLNFSDPWPKKGHAKRRLTHRGFLATYKELLVPDGLLKFKTDNAGLFDFSLGELAAAGTETLFYTRDLHASVPASENVETEYERNFSAKGFPICSIHVRFTKKEEPMSLHDLILKARSYRSFDPGVQLTREQLLKYIDCARLTSSSMNLQPIKYRPVTDPQECAKLFPLTCWAGKIKNTKVPPEGHEPPAYIIVCTDASVTQNAHSLLKDVGICAEAILLASAEDGFGGCMLGAFDAEAVRLTFGLADYLKPQLILALGKPDETVELIEFSEDRDGTTEPFGKVPTYYRENGIHYVQKRRLDDILLG